MAISQTRLFLYPLALAAFTGLNAGVSAQLYFSIMFIIFGYIGSYASVDGLLLFCYFTGRLRLFRCWLKGCLAVSLWTKSVRTFGMLMISSAP